MIRLSIDLETYSSVDLAECGVYKYAESEDFEVLLLAYSYDDDPIEVIDVASGERVPAGIIRDLLSSEVLKMAYNATFERVCLSRVLGQVLDPAQWQCTMVHAALLGLPGSLAMVAGALQLTEQKDAAGKLLINYFSKPCKPSRSNGERTRNFPRHDPEKWELFKKYNAQDVATEKAIKARLNELLPFPEYVQQQYVIDQRINDYGAEIDLDLVQRIKDYLEEHLLAPEAEAQKLTQLDNPKSVSQLKSWITDQGVEIDSLGKAQVAELLQNKTLPADVRRVLELRQETSKTSTKKYDKMLAVAMADGRARGMIQFYGAGRTGRYAGRTVQIQNLPRNYVKDIGLIREVIKSGHVDALELIYPSLSDLFSQLIRTAFVAGPNKTYVISDYSAIEARVIAWVAKEQWAIDVFNGDGKIYEGTYSKMFKVPAESITKDQRQRGKVTVLGLGYGGGPAALINMGALKMGIPEDELPGLVSMWRKTNRNIVKLWGSVESKAKEAMMHPGKNLKLWDEDPDIRFFADQGNLYIQLPSGRLLTYFAASLVSTARESRIEYWGVNTARKWAQEHTWGGKLTENIIQAIARDVLAEALTRIYTAYPSIVFHIHDEVVVEVPKADEDVAYAQIKGLMASPLSWAPGLTLPAVAFTSDFYMKD